MRQNLDKYKNLNREDKLEKVAELKSQNHKVKLPWKLVLQWQKRENEIGCILLVSDFFSWNQSFHLKELQIFTSLFIFAWWVGIINGNTLKCIYPFETNVAWVLKWIYLIKTEVLLCLMSVLFGLN